ncbi:hypothetical protein HBI26_021110 [Parastagonospora nodorum]|nr:hypothetical protein HBH51_037410 [Parastagonospora nodorum]KAH4607705.1 hypothetical protein HBH82_081780 [Parastagonospora nodorum]KAH4696619.1 hypothetical protein HBH78_069610 [Parastagonospora nodorum]KAH4709794.1 hypothetical protein HBH67_045760 [Parastagonospora nodorum]KAH4782818.1 hypothetical protein HBH62_111730 [Parastagonospora nodorum]
MTRITYKYTDLNYKLGQEIRLIVVAPGETTDDLQCDIIHVNLEDNPDYEAVSYTWASDDGDASLTQRINCGRNAYLPITANCEAAIRQLRKCVFKRRLWIDAICIHQTNIKERNHQVGLMDLVYSLARSVRICIQDHRDPEGIFKYADLFGLLRHDSDMGNPGVKTWGRPGVSQLLSLRYFKRAWVIQEVVLAKAAYLLLNQNELLLTSEVMARLVYLAKKDEYELPAVLRLKELRSEAISSNIIACLRAGLECQCVDPRDNIFAVVSLMDPRSRSLIPIDYSVDCTSVYASAVLAVIAQQRSLDILSYIRYIHVWDPTGSSRAPENHGFRVMLEQFKHFLADKDSQRRTAKIRTVDRISLIGRLPLIRQFRDYTQGLWRGQVEVQIVETIPSAPGSSKQSADLPVRFCRTAQNKSILPRFQVRAHFVDTIPKQSAESNLRIPERAINMIVSHLPQDSCCDIVKSCYAWILPFFERKSDTAVRPVFFENEPYHFDFSGLNALLEEAQQCTDKLLSPFYSSNSLGFAPGGQHSLKENDEVWVLDGARSPFVLRKTGDKTFRIVSECYLWAALELDYWNPGSGKGRLCGRQLAPYAEQTHIIEIHCWERETQSSW